MKNKLKIIFLSGLILSLGACSNIQNTFTATPVYTETEKINFNVQEETQLFALGSYKINESGAAVANMKAEEQAKIFLKKQIFNETTNVLNLFFSEINTKSILISKNTIKDLSNLVSSELIKDTTTTNTWNNEGEEFVVLAIDKSRIPEKVKEKFVTYIQTIIDDLDSAITKVSNEYMKIDKPSIIVTTEEKFQVQQTETTNIENLELQNPLDSLDSEKNSEPEVFLEDF